MNALEVAGLHKAYGAVRAVDGVDLAVEGGEVFGAWGLAGLLLAARFFRWEPVPDTGRRRHRRARPGPPG